MVSHHSVFYLCLASDLLPSTPPFSPSVSLCMDGMGLDMSSARKKALQMVWSVNGGSRVILVGESVLGRAWEGVRFLS